MQERRRYERFGLKLPCRIEVINPKGKEHLYDIVTTDVSAGGVFFHFLPSDCTYRGVVINH